MNLPGIRAAMKASDDVIAQNVAAVEHSISEFAAEIPLKGLSVQRMHDIEERGIALCKDRLAELEAEIARLQGEAKNTAAIIEASSMKLMTLKKHLAASIPVEPNEPVEHASSGEA